MSITTCTNITLGRKLMNRAQDNRIRLFGEINLVRNHREEDGECRAGSTFGDSSTLLQTTTGVDYSRISSVTSISTHTFPHKPSRCGDLAITYCMNRHQKSTLVTFVEDTKLRVLPDTFSGRAYWTLPVDEQY